MSKFNVGDKVRYIGKDHRGMPEFYPEIGTIGVIKSITKPNAWVRWLDVSASGSNCWCCPLDSIERIVENMTNEEIWEMLRPKMEKNKLEPMGTCTKWRGCVPEYFYTYSEDDVHNAIAAAYRSGYERAMKGRPFKFGEKKKGGHWEPIDPNNLPKEGTRVRYSRECKEYKAYKNTLVILGDLGKVDIAPEGWFGIRLDNPRSSYSWLSFHDDGIASCLDMWVEDDE